MTGGPVRPAASKLAELRGALLEDLAVGPAAWSGGQGEFGFVTFIEDAPEPGSYLRLLLDDGTVLLAEVHGTTVATSVLAHVQATPLEDVTASVPVTLRHVEGAGVVLGCVGDDGVTAFDGRGFTGAMLAPALPDDLRAHRAHETAGSAALTIGEVAAVHGVPAHLKGKGFNRHTLLCGQSGSGKTFSTGILLEQILLETDLRMFVLDPNSDFVRIREPRSRDEMNRGRPEPLSEADYDALCARYAERAADVRIASAADSASGGGDAPLRIHFSDLSLDEQAACLELDPTHDLAEFNVLLHVVGSLGPVYDLRGVRAAAADLGGGTGDALVQRIENLGVADWALWAPADEPSLLSAIGSERGWVIDLGSLPTVAERHLAALVALGRFQHREERQPLLLVVDEAHNLCPPATDDLLVRETTARMVWAAGEGRKYGGFLLLATQRPQKLHPNVVSQCENLVLMRVNSRSDREALAELFSAVPAAMVEASRGFGLGEALVSGPVSPTPMRVRMGGRISTEGGADLPTDWARAR